MTIEFNVKCLKYISEVIRGLQFFATGYLHF